MAEASVPTVLIVEDQQDTREVLRVFFEQQGFAVFEAEDPAAASRLFKEHRPDLLVADILLSGDPEKEEGLALNSDLASWAGDVGHQYIPVAITAADRLDGQLPDEATAVFSFDYYFGKPIDFEKLEAMLVEEFGQLA